MKSRPASQRNVVTHHRNASRITEEFQSHFPKTFGKPFDGRGSGRITTDDPASHVQVLTHPMGMITTHPTGILPAAHRHVVAHQMLELHPTHKKFYRPHRHCVTHAHTCVCRRFPIASWKHVVAHRAWADRLNHFTRCTLKSCCQQSSDPLFGWVSSLVPTYFLRLVVRPGCCDWLFKSIRGSLSFF